MKRSAKEWESMYNHAVRAALKATDARDAASRVLAQIRDDHNTRIEALHADLRVRTEERDAARAEASKYAEASRLVDDLRAQVKQAQDGTDAWQNTAMDALIDAGRAKGYAEVLARLVAANCKGADELACIILTNVENP